MIKRVTIENFKCITKKQMDLTKKKVTIIKGENMSGKTTTLDAIHWAITGRTLDGSNDNAALKPLYDRTASTKVVIEFDKFTLERGLEQPTVTVAVSQYIKIDGERASTLKQGEAIINAKLGLTDIAIMQPKGFEIKSFLLNPLYFNTLSPSLFRKFLYKMADIDLKSMYDSFNAPTKKVMESIKKGEYDAYILLDELGSKQRETKKTLDALKVVSSLIKDNKEVKCLLDKFNEENVKLNSASILIKEFSKQVNVALNEYYEKMGIQIQLLEETKEGTKEVCYPTLINKLAFSQGSYAERTLVAIIFATKLAKEYRIAPLPLLVDNMESLDKGLMQGLNDYIEENKIQLIGAKVI